METHPCLMKILNTPCINGGNKNETEGISSLTPEDVKTDFPHDASVNTNAALNNKRKAHHVQHCAAINCKNNRFDTPEKSFFRFPKNEERCKQWVVNTRRKDIVKKTPEQLFQGSVLCSDHFEDSQFTSATKKRLKPKSAIPTLFDVPNPPHKLPNPPHELLNSPHELSNSPHELPNSSHELPNSHELPAPPHEIQAPPHELPAPPHELPAPPHKLPNPPHKLMPPRPAPKPCTSDFETITCFSSPSHDTSDILEPMSGPCNSAVPISKMSAKTKNYEEEIKILKRKLDTTRKRVSRLEKKVNKQMTSKKEIDFIKTMSAKYMNSDVHEFFCQQLDVSVHKMKGNRWTSRAKDFALSIFEVSPTAYRLLRKQFHFPSKHTLRRMVKNIE